MKKIIFGLFVCITSFVPNAMAHEFSWNDLMLAAIKVNPHFDYESNVESYMQIYMPDVWNRVKNDEFELHDKKAEAIKIMKERVEAFSLEEDFSIFVGIDFQDYDFEKNVFPVVKMNPNMFFRAHNVRHGSFPFEYKVFFSNPQFFQDIQMSKDEAKGFVQSRKSSNGQVDRTLATELRFRVTKLKNTRDELEAVIVGITTYRDKQQTIILQNY